MYLNKLLKHTKYSNAYILIVICFICGCVSTSQNIKIDNKRNYPLPPKLENWQADGRISLSVKDESSHANFRWSQKNNEFRLRLSFVGGFKSITVLGNDFGVEEIEGIQSDEKNLIDALNNSIPIEQLKYWLLGKSNPNLDSRMIALTEDGVVFNQLDWTIRVMKVQKFNSLVLPKRILIENIDSNAQIIIDKWTFQTNR
jgi:outer membrane biogenesis lipoprotein LolB